MTLLREEFASMRDGSPMQRQTLSIVNPVPLPAVTSELQLWRLPSCCREGLKQVLRIGFSATTALCCVNVTLHTGLKFLEIS